MHRSAITKSSIENPQNSRMNNNIGTLYVLHTILVTKNVKHRVIGMCSTNQWKIIIESSWVAEEKFSGEEES